MNGQQNAMMNQAQGVALGLGGLQNYYGCTCPPRETDPIKVAKERLADVEKRLADTAGLLVEKERLLKIIAAGNA